MFLLLIFETMQLHTNNPVNEFKSQTFVHTASAYTYMLEHVGCTSFHYSVRVRSGWLFQDNFLSFKISYYCLVCGLSFHDVARWLIGTVFLFLVRQRVNSS